LFKETSLFDTPKPEHLIQRILQISTNPGDIVLDPYLGSGTTAAVAHKMNRSYLGIEIGDHIKTHCAHRLTQVIAGESGGISALIDWKGGGGFDFYCV
jgi:adenine-specific DNA-methyltransferase